ncbi:hypothetical protein NMYAN_10451 [Nitrosomonas nitrosa]|uniref:Uncharacterized protein n=1 Tax=Nitrosomonas nitrosa TaxID=52442 RepID=A0A8H8YZA8_9PROT|nr:hypothetical protein NMYAN_10451 [Nitrosomonas nitrosa]
MRPGKRVCLLKNDNYALWLLMRENLCHSQHPAYYNTCTLALAKLAQSDDERLKFL